MPFLDKEGLAHFWNHITARLNTKVEQSALDNLEASLTEEIENLDYMSTTNPVGTGSFSMNRASDTTVGTYSSTLGSNCEASGSDSHAEGSYTVASGTASHAEGCDTNAAGVCSHVEGDQSQAHGYASHAEGNSSAEGEYSHAEGNSHTTTDGSYSHAEGFSSTASAWAAHAEGDSSTASGKGSHAEGGSYDSNGNDLSSTSITIDSDGTVNSDGTVGGVGKTFTVNGATASGVASHAEGVQTVASGWGAHSEGYRTVAYNSFSHAEGAHTKAKGIGSHAEGYDTIAMQYQHISGKYNVWKTPPVTPDTQLAANTDAIFVVGCGTSSARKTAFRISSGGKCFGAVAFGASGADFAELFEWADGNPNNEDRRGLFVTLDGDKIRLANADDNYIGVISGAQAFIGNSASEEWHGKYLTDVFGSKLSQEIEVPAVINETTGEVITPAITTTQFVLNPNYNPDEEYIMRENRKEWGIVGLLGQVVMVDDGSCVVGGYVKPSVNGVGTTSNNGYRVMKRIDENHIKVLVK